MQLSEIKLVIWDLDETLWKGIISEGEVELNEELAAFIRNTTDMGIVHSICSKNELGQVRDKLTQAGLWDYFVFPSVDWTPKGARVNNILSEMNLRAANVLFVDDNVQNLNEVKFYCPGISALLPEALAELCAEAEKAPKTDLAHKRLKQYRILEQKELSRNSFDSNTDFLMSCNIRADICGDCLEHIDRLHDLLMRSNQLNYTKFRQPKEELRALLSEEGVKSGYVKVRDNFGDYGIVGFFAVKDGKAVHFLFSCRTLGMLVEQYTYMMAGCPEIDVVGEVVTKLNKEDMPPWINQKNAESEEKSAAELSKKVLFKGPCDMRQMFSFIRENENIVTEFTYTNSEGISVEGHNHTGQTATALLFTPKQKEETLNEFGFFDKDMLNTSLQTQAFDAVAFSMLCDSSLGLYRNRKNGALISMCERVYDLTDEKNWDKYISGEIFTSNIAFTRRELERFAESYEYVPNDDWSETIDSLDKIYKTIKTKKLILILGSERDFNGPAVPNTVNRHNIHRAMNEKIKEWAKDKEKVALLPLDNVVLSDRDFVDTINHLTKSAYYRLAGELVSIIGGEGNIRASGKGTLVYQILKQKAINIRDKIKK